MNERNEPNGTPPESKSYLSDFFTPQRLGVDPNKPVGTIGRVLWIKDPYGNPYGYSTIGLKAEQDFRADTTKPRPTGTNVKGYNPTCDIWSTAGKTGSPTTDTNVWVKNW